MPADIIDGDAIARQVRAELVPRIGALRQRGVQPGLAVILVGENPASVTYVRHKMKDCAELGLTGETFRFPIAIAQDELIDAVHRVNDDRAWHGLIVQTPLPGVRMLDPSSRV